MQFKIWQHMAESCNKSHIVKSSQTFPFLKENSIIFAVSEGNQIILNQFIGINKKGQSSSWLFKFEQTRQQFLLEWILVIFLCYFGQWWFVCKRWAKCTISVISVTLIIVFTNLSFDLITVRHNELVYWGLFVTLYM